MLKRKIAVSFIILLTVTLIIGFTYHFFSGTKAGSGKWTIVVLDSNTKKEIDTADLIITDLNKKYTITKSDNSISLPQKPTGNDKSKYPFGYTIITYSKGYMPRIDHNMVMGNDGVTKIEIELSKPEPLSNQTFTEQFHYLGDSAVADLLGYYLGNIN
jgi:hypothetical protein